MNLQLRAMNEHDAKAEYDYFQQMPVENGFQVPYKRLTLADFMTTALPERLRIAQGIVTPPQLPNTYFFLWAGDQLVGLFVVRPILDEQLRRLHGHIGYGILPQFRGRGLATRGLALALRECGRMMPASERNFILICDITNPASLRVMLNNGGHIFKQDATDNFVNIPRSKPTVNERV